MSKDGGIRCGPCSGLCTPSPSSHPRTQHPGFVPIPHGIPSLTFVVLRAYMTAAPRCKLFSCYICAWLMVMSTPLSCYSITYSVSFGSPRHPPERFHGCPAPHCDSSARQPELSHPELVHIRACAVNWLIRRFLMPQTADVCGEDVYIVLHYLPAN